MTSRNDTTILAMLSRFPDMPADEADSYISKIEHEENVPICHAVIGRVSPDSLGNDARETFDEFSRWSQNRTVRTRQEQWDARRRRRENRTATNLLRLRDRGIVSDDMLVMYGISGELPERSTFLGLDAEEKERLFAQRMEDRFGPNWQEMFDQQRVRLPLYRFNERVALRSRKPNWLREGF